MRKFFAKTAAALALSTAFLLAGCGGSSMLTETPNQGLPAGSEGVGAYEALVYYETEEPDDVRIPFEAEEVQKVSYKYRVLGEKEYSFKNDVLTVKKSVFEGETAGDKRLRVFVNNAYTEITVRIVSKVIYTTEDFNGIRNDLNGVYVLGADIDFANEPFYPIGKDPEGGSSRPFEGIFDGRGYALKNITVNAYDRGVGEDGSGQGPSLGGKVENGSNYNNGIFMSTGGSAQIINTDFVNVSVTCQGLGGAVVGNNGGLIKNCRVSCSLTFYGYYERAAGIAGINGSGDAAGKIENCIVVYSSHGESGSARGIADWNFGTIRNCYAAVADDYVFHVGYDNETKSVPADFDYDEWILSDMHGATAWTTEVPEGQTWNWQSVFSWDTLPAVPGNVDTSQKMFYKGGDIINSEIVRKEFLLDPANFPQEDGWDSEIWNFTRGTFPTLKIQSR